MKRSETNTAPQQVREMVETRESVYDLKSLQDVFDLDIADAPTLDQASELCPCICNGFPEPSNIGIQQFEAWFVALPEIYIPEAASFMDAYQAGKYSECFALVSINTVRQEPSKLLSLYLASAALATYDVTQAKEFLSLFTESDEFTLGSWWYRGLYHILLQEKEQAIECLTIMLNAPLPVENRLVRAWSIERKEVAKEILQHYKA